MQQSERSRSLGLAGILVAALGLRLLVAWADYGFVATDDHDHMLIDAVPASRAPTPAMVVQKSGVRSPLPRLGVHFLARVALGLGLQDPLDQIRFVYAALGLFSICSVWLAWKLFDQMGRGDDWGLHAAAWTGFHFLAVFVSTRALVESMAAPFLTLSGVLLVRYVRRGEARSLLGSLTALTASSMFRFQAGIIVLPLLATPVLRRAWRDVAMSVAFASVLFVLSGWPDFVLRGSFHASLRQYLLENIKFSSTYGVSAWYDYLLLLVAASLPPLLIARYRGFPWRFYFLSLWPILAMVGTFVAAHSLIPHKEDRFMIPILPLYLALLAPLSSWLFSRRPYSWRSFGFVLINAVLILLIAASPTQNNTIALVRYLDRHPSIGQVWALGDSLTVYPTAYGAREPAQLSRIDFLPLRQARTAGCGTLLAVREDLVGGRGITIEGWIRVAEFLPGALEKLLTITNPRRNARRGTLQVFLPEGCPAPD